VGVRFEGDNMKKLFLVFSFSIFIFNCFAQSWYPLSSGLEGNGSGDRVDALCGDSIHHIMWSGGSFQMAGGDSIANLAGWTGTDWIPVTVISGVDTVPKNFYRKITALIMFDNKLFIAEAKTTSGNTRSNVYVYDRDSLTCVAVASFNKDVNVFHIYNNELYAGGEFANSADSNIAVFHSTKCIARWNGTYFVGVGVGLFGEVTTLCTYNGNLLASGHIVSSFGAGTTEHGMPGWNGVQWISVVDSFGPTADYNNIFISSLCEYNGKLFVGCRETFGELPSDLMIWNGVSWDSSSIYYGIIFNLIKYNNDLFIAGDATMCGWWNQVTYFNNLFFNCTGYGPLAGGSLNMSLMAVLDGYLYASGEFIYIGDTSNLIYAGFVARYDPTPLPTVTVISSNINCNEICTGSASANATGAGQLTYLWSNGATIDTISNLCAGTYTVTVTDSLGISVSDTVIVTEPPAIVITDTSTNTSCATCSNGSATINVSGGVGELTILWSNGATTLTINNLLPGTYTVVVTDSNGCAITDTLTIGFDDGVSELQFSENNFQLFPNPIADRVTVQLHSPCNNCTIEISNVLGAILFTNELNLKSKICNLKSFPSGIYFIKVKNDKWSEVKRVVKE